VFFRDFGGARSCCVARTQQIIIRVCYMATKVKKKYNCVKLKIDWLKYDKAIVSVFGPEGVLNQRVNAACLFHGW
jgi:hypothetical protein